MIRSLKLALFARGLLSRSLSMQSLKLVAAYLAILGALFLLGALL